MLGLQLTGVSRSFGGHKVLQGVDLSVGRGEIVGFIGGNGAGKTTTMRLILGLLTATEGRIEWDGEAITDQVRSSIGYMPEERGLYPEMTVEDQIVHFALLEGKSHQQARATAAELISSLGLSTRERTKVQDLSLGNQQRVQLAVSLVGDPTLLVLDEPFSGLDPLAVETMAGLIADQARRGVGVLFSSHQLELVERICDRVCVLDKGRVVASGPVDELRGGQESLWKLRFAAVPSDRLIAELSMLPHITLEALDDEPEALLVHSQREEEQIPSELLAVLMRNPGLRAIEPLQRSLAEVLSERLSASLLTDTANASADLESIGA
ncbi:ATP-binding cassette domain-containing protein [Glutamicibacter sp. PS]|uniref:ABC transporter ATP-binding protein n=1 Tax=Glutamicibacter sp. PS TaxID=3075634 RepID=UPI002845FE78|nr:ATP-binding cassette domain-containing protein [Glutamicibacter sp. PS]MDR4533629.1 ATP-binding cassette domain-containing protein [Glutamicibacter sp. PS]